MNLLFSCMFRIERKLFMLARKNTSRYISNKFTLNRKILALLFVDTEDYVASEKWQKIFICILIIAPLLRVPVNVAQR